jgi:hypothetical protein
MVVCSNKCPTGLPRFQPIPGKTLKNLSKWPIIFQPQTFPQMFAETLLPEKQLNSVFYTRL